MADVTLINEGSYQSELSFYPDAGRTCLICGREINEIPFVAITLRWGRGATVVAIHKRHFSEEAIEYMDEKTAEEVAKSL